MLIELKDPDQAQQNKSRIWICLTLCRYSSEKNAKTFIKVKLHVEYDMLVIKP